MLYLKRKIDAFLSEWKANPDKKPLIVKGPRQVARPNPFSALPRQLHERYHDQLRGGAKVQNDNRGRLQSGGYHQKYLAYRSF